MGPLYGGGKMEEALPCCKHMLEVAPNTVAAWNLKGHVLESAGKFNEALARFENALKISATFVSTWTGKGGIR